MTFDRMDYYFEKALEIYCEESKKDSSQLIEKELEEVQYRASNHIGFFLAWIIKNDFIGEIHRKLEEDGIESAVDAVKNEKMSGTEFFLEQCDGKFWDEDVSDEILPFVEKYYEDYFHEYVTWVIEDLGDLPMEFIGTWEDYHQFEHILDEAYKEFCKSL
ncbi:MAG: hypothetical protein K2M46_13195 [Lachnospiraceae bacterium]|nr:hypothetical protein [Lachnospiraceae bacterium]